MNISSKYYICTLSRHVSQTQFELFSVCMKRKRSGLLGIFPTFLQFLDKMPCSTATLSLLLRIFSKYLAWNWLTGYYWIGCLCIILRTQNFPITITNFTGCQCSIVNKWLLGNGQYIQMCWDHKASWLFPKASRPNDIVLLQR